MSAYCRHQEIRHFLARIQCVSLRMSLGNQQSLPPGKIRRVSMKPMCWNHQKARGPRGFL